jgi:hypothetical protein
VREHKVTIVVQDPSLRTEIIITGVGWDSAFPYVKGSVERLRAALVCAL